MNDELRSRLRSALELITPVAEIVQEVWIEEESALESVPENLCGSP